MPVRAYSFSTAVVNDPKTQRLNDSMIFTTPPTDFFRRPIDKNNNVFGDRNDDQSMKSTSDFSSGLRSPFADSICDDCACSRAGLVLRWCETCSKAICDACILDGHAGGHSVIWYQEAARMADRKLGEALQHARCEMKQFSTKRKRARRFHHGIVMKMDQMKRKVEQHAAESNELVGGGNGQLNELMKLNDVKLNANTWVARRHARVTSEMLLNGYSNRQASVAGQLKRISLAITHMCDNIGQEGIGDESL